MYAHDTIVAVATPPGVGGIGIVRVSGPAALAIAEQAFVPSVPGTAESHRLRHGRLVDAAGETIDEVLLVCMRAPRTYTGEDVVEIHCHGSPLLLRRVLGRCCECGARPAEPGEFTKRAFLNDRLDLTQAEAVAEVIAARTEAAARTALRLLSGSISSELQVIRDILVGLEARAEAMIDFAEEDIDVTAGALLADIDAATARLEPLLATYAAGRLLRDGLHLVLVGRPNAGKSSLLNALLGRDRAIVSARPGTTRDVIAESLEIAGVPVTVADTAGVHASEDEIERIGIDRTRREAGSADIVLLVLDRAAPLTEDDRALLSEWSHASVLIVANKLDLPAAWTSTDVHELGGRTLVEVSALTGAGLDALRAGIATLAGAAEIDPHVPVITLARHRDALLRVLEALALARDSLRAAAPIDLAAVDIQAAVEHIGSITGEVTTEEVLDRIFREFCIGK